MSKRVVHIGWSMGPDPGGSPWTWGGGGGVSEMYTAI